MNKIIYLFAFIIFLNSAIAGAECISTIVANPDYLPLETVQVEITSNADRDLKSTDLLLFNYDVQAYTQFNLIKFSDQKYFLFFDLPQSSGDYYLKIKNYCNGNLETHSTQIKTKEPIERFYSNLKDSLKNNLYTVSLDQLTLSGKIFAYDEEFSEQIYSAYSSRADNCIKKECDIKWVALGSISFPLIREQLITKIKANEISNQGQWKITLNDSSAKCNISINNGNQTELNSYFLDLSSYASEKILISLICDKEINAKLTHIYGNDSNEFDFVRNGNILTYNLDNMGCFSSVIGGNCDVNSTLYSLYALKENNYAMNQRALSWLYSQNLTNSDRALLYYLAGDVNSLVDLSSSQSRYGWYSLTNENYKEDVLTTSRMAFAMEKFNDQINSTFSQRIIDAQDYLRNKFYSASATTKENMLWFVFTDKKIEPISAIWPGIIQTQSLGKLDLILKNNGKNNITATILLLNSTHTYNISSKTIKKLTFNLPFIGTTDARTITDNLFVSLKLSDIQNAERDYSIPLIILTNKSSTNITGGGINSSSTEIDETDIPSVPSNYTEIDSDLIEKNFYFIEKEIKKDISSKEGEEIFSITLKNKFDSEIKNIEITTSSSLITLGPQLSVGFINSLASDAEKEIKITINPNEVIASKQYSGEIIARGYIDNQKVEARIPVAFNISVQEDKTCSELGGKECGTSETCSGNLKKSSDVILCCIGECKGQGGNQTIGFIILGVVLALLLGVLFFLKRKPKKEMNEFIKEAEKRYEHTFQRPANTK